MTRKPFVLAISVGLILLVIFWGLDPVLAYFSRDTHDHRPDVVGLFGGEGGFATVVHPTKVQAFRVGLKRGALRGSDWPLTDYEDIAGPITSPTEAVRSRSASLTSPDSYYWHEAGVKACITLYGVRLEFNRGPQRVDVYLCFGCNNLLVVSDGKKRGKDFYSTRPALVRAIKKTFPTDPEIQKLGEKW